MTPTKLLDRLLNWVLDKACQINWQALGTADPPEESFHDYEQRRLYE